MGVESLNPVQIYYDVCKEIEIYEWRLQDLEGELKAIRRVIFTGMEPSDPRPVHIPLDKALERYDRIVEQIREVSTALEKKQMIRRQIERLLQQLEGLELRVAYMRDIERKPLQVIAEELGYSYSHVSKISSRVKSAKRVKNGFAKT